MGKIKCTNVAQKLDLKDGVGLAVRFNMVPPDTIGDLDYKY